jgi:hypothetical protein
MKPRSANATNLEPVADSSEERQRKESHRQLVRDWAKNWLFFQEQIWEISR